MKRFLVFCLVLYAGSSLANGSVQLEHICPSYTFKSDGLLINAVHRTKTSFTLPPVSHYLADGNCDAFKFKDESNRLKAELLKTEYNGLISKYYSERYMNDYDKDKDFDDLFYAHIEYVPDYLNRLDEIKSSEGNAACLVDLEAKIKQGALFVNTLLNYLNVNLQDSKSDEAIPKKADEINKIQRIIDGFDLDANQKFAFAGQPIEKIYENASLRKEKFVLNRQSKMFFDKKSNGTFFYSIGLPFNTQVQYEESKDSCLTIFELPGWFFNEYLRHNRFHE